MKFFNEHFVLILCVSVFLITYYCWYYWFYIKSKKIKDIDNFKENTKDINNFNIFASNNGDMIEHDQVDAKLLESKNQNSNKWNKALEELQAQSSEIIGENKLRDFLEDQNIDLQE